LPAASVSWVFARRRLSLLPRTCQCLWAPSPMNRTDPLEYLFGLERFRIKFGVENMRALVASLGHPERAFRSVHIAGTNGKGSVTAIVDAALRAAGSRSGGYTSRPLGDLCE